MADESQIPEEELDLDASPEPTDDENDVELHKKTPPGNKDVITDPVGPINY
jgi:hypothetical protein